jgi:hypothetical protein
MFKPSTANSAYLTAAWIQTLTSLAKPGVSPEQYVSKETVASLIGDQEAQAIKEEALSFLARAFPQEHTVIQAFFTLANSRSGADAMTLEEISKVQTMAVETVATLIRLDKQVANYVMNVFRTWLHEVSVFLKQREWNKLPKTSPAEFAIAMKEVLDRLNYEAFLEKMTRYSSSTSVLLKGWFDAAKVSSRIDMQSYSSVSESLDTGADATGNAVQRVLMDTFSAPEDYLYFIEQLDTFASLQIQESSLVKTAVERDLVEEEYSGALSKALDAYLTDVTDLVSESTMASLKDDLHMYYMHRYVQAKANGLENGFLPKRILDEILHIVDSANVNPSVLAGFSGRAMCNMQITTQIDLLETVPEDQVAGSRHTSVVALAQLAHLINVLITIKNGAYVSPRTRKMIIGLVNEHIVILRELAQDGAIGDFEILAMVSPYLTAVQQQLYALEYSKDEHSAEIRDRQWNDINTKVRLFVASYYNLAEITGL